MRLHVEDLVILYRPIPLKNNDHYAEKLPKSKDNFEVKMYTTEAIKAITPTS